MVGVGWEVEVVDSYVAALADKFESDGAANSCRAASDGSRFGSK